MTKLTKLAVLSAMSAATISTPLATAFAQRTLYEETITKRQIETNPSLHHSRIHSSISHHKHHHSPHTHVHHEHRTYHHHHVEHKKHHYHVHEHHVNRIDNNKGDTLAAGVLGLAVGTILGNVLKQPEQPQVIYQISPPNQVIYQVQPTVTYQPPKPSNINWYQYCKQTYRSFNPKTGTFRGHDGLDHVCYAPLQ
ncbi:MULTISPECIES: BA14K family protein [unclassified Bartonella]|uniref:BA14K family protein n=1 Tax=unclassified Bartonella TaxID=2645622 RepID=UPI00099943E8|nr:MULTISPECIES: BA14K family protein [unclassified Bartonella]AQX27611.1 BA14K-like protein [Bartonella sp. JB15]AQX28892.1 BA14K-like protein [Bartonella sp. JB63]